MDTPKVTAAKNSGLQDDHDPNDPGQKLVNKPNAEKSQMEGPAAYARNDEGEEKAQGIIRDQRGQDQPADKGKAQQTSSRRQHGQDDPPLQNAKPGYREGEPAKKKPSEA
jgi:hypothetical protein